MIGRTIKSFLNRLRTRTDKEDDSPSESGKASQSDGYSWIPDWQEILGEDWSKWQELVSKPRKGPKVLITTMVGGNSFLSPMETVLAVALTLRGADVHFILCDKQLTACQNCHAGDLENQKQFVENGPDSCDWCFDVGQKTIGQLGLTLHRYSDFSIQEDFEHAKNIAEKLETIDDIFAYQSDGIEHHDIVKSSVLRYFARCDLDTESYALPVARRYLQASIVTNRALNRLFDKHDFEHVISNQAMYVPQLNVAKVANLRGKHLVAWDIGYRQNTLNVCHDQTHLFALLDEPNECWENILWNDQTENEIREYLTGRWSSKYDWMKILTQGEDTDPDEIHSSLGIDSSKPVIGMLTNVMWDAQVTYKAAAFKTQIDWIVHTINYFRERKDLQLLIRVHPSELHGWIVTRQFVLDELEKHFDTMPDNVFIIPPESEINTYKAMLKCDSVLIYGTTAGLEMLCMGLPVIVSGRAWIRTKEICIPVSNPEEYTEKLDQLPIGRRLNEKELERALKFAYHFYLRRMIPVQCTEPQNFKFSPYKIKNQPLDKFDRGSDPGLDVVCDGILRNTPFIFEAERSST